MCSRFEEISSIDVAAAEVKAQTTQAEESAKVVLYQEMGEKSLLQSDALYQVSLNPLISEFFQ